jgi:hypothetical protein
MRNWPFEKVGAAAGVAFVVLTIVGNVIGGSPPATDDPPAKIVSFFSDNDRAIVVGAVLTSIAAPLFLALVVALVLRMYAVGQRALAAAALAFGVAGLTLGAASDALYGVLAKLAPGGDAQLVHGLYELDGFVAARSFWLAAAFLLVTAWAAWARSLPRWYGLLSLAAAVLLALGGASLRTTGFFAPFGEMTFVAFLALLVWTLATCLVVWRGTPQVRAAV